MIATGSLPPPSTGLVPVPVGIARMGPIAFRPDRGPESGAKSTVFIDDPEPGLVTLTGEFYPPGPLTAYRIGSMVLSVLGLFALIGALVILLGNEAQHTLGLVLCFGGLAALMSQIIWRAVLVHSARAATLTVRSVDLQRVRTTVNHRMLSWWLVIGPFALIPLFAGRRMLRVEVPVAVDGRLGVLRLVLREQRRGDAEMVALRLRLAGAR